MTTTQSFLGTSLNAVTATGAGNVIQFDAPKHIFGMQVTTTGSPASFNINLEGTIDGTNYVTLSSATAAGIGTASTTIVAMAIRANLTAFSGGTSPTFTATVAAATA